MLLQLGDKGDNVKYLQYGLHILCCSPMVLMVNLEMAHLLP